MFFYIFILLFAGRLWGTKCSLQ